MVNGIAIKIKNLTKTYKLYKGHKDRVKETFHPYRKKYHYLFNALTDLSLEVNKGEILGIIGSNGSGKSTLLQIICGTMLPTSGQVQTAGHISALLELGTGFNPEFTGRENVYMNCALMGLSKKETDKLFDTITDFADIGEFIEQPVKTYSSGMYVRLAFAVQTQVNPEIFVVDEALAVGDEKFQRKCFSRMEQMNENGTTILFVSHSSQQISELCDRALLMNRGERILLSDPLQVIRAYQKLIYAPEDEKNQIIANYKLKDASGLLSESDHVGKDTAKISEPENKLDDNVNDHFDPELVPETTQSYPIQGAKIEKIEILDKQGRYVNVITLGNVYKFLLKGRFLKSFQSVYFGIHIRSITGVVITGQRFPEIGKSIMDVTAGDDFSVAFSFKITMLEEFYFVGGGIWTEHEPFCLHRLLDKIMFRIKKTGCKTFSFGYYDTSFDEPVLKIS